MVVVDASALIPLTWVGRLDLISTTFDVVRTTEEVRNEVLAEGKRGTAILTEFLQPVEIHGTPDAADEVAAMEGVAVADASVMLMAEATTEPLLANDRGLIDVARSHGVECWWVTTLLLSCTKNGTLTAEEGIDLLYELVDEGMNLHPKVYVRVQRKLRELGD